ncbi:Serine/threonine-protein kinase EDR1 [Acorus calamus]|uniref:non-specific serine/threonine protein kinase n=1 Tax=Acorus calamus TaxID=4465 RepID=A0AAV9DNE4_ACOCL|nr:Serine/threonine-protein kinase EDR1 [Acorus calamus]
MKNLLKNLHIMSDKKLSKKQRPPSGFSNWFSSSGKRGGSDRTAEAAAVLASVLERVDSPGGGGGRGGEAAAGEAEMEEYQVRLALEMSAREDPEAAQIEAVKRISLESRATERTLAEVLAYQYWNYNALSYDDKILDGFYDLYGILAEPTSVTMPSLVDLQGMPMSDNISCEAILVNRAEDADLLTLERRVHVMAIESGEGSLNFNGRDLVQKLAVLVSDYMGGPVGDPERMLKAWRMLSNHLRSSVGNMVLADSIGVPCQLVKAQQYTGLDDGAVNIVKFNDGREFIVDLMGDPGTLIPSDTAGPQTEYEIPFSPLGSSLGDVDNCNVVSTNSGATSSIGCSSESETVEKRFNERDNLDESRFHENQRSCSIEEFSDKRAMDNESRICDDSSSSSKGEVLDHEISTRLNHPYNHARSPTWTEGACSPAARRVKVNNVSQYMIDAAKENPSLAQKLHDVLLESGVVAPRNLFSDIYSEEQEALIVEDANQSEDKEEETKRKRDNRHLPPLPKQNVQQKAVLFRPQMEQRKPVDGLGVQRTLDLQEASGPPCSSQSEKSCAQSQDSFPMKLLKHMPVTAVAATAAVVASSMVVSVAKATSDSNTEVPATAAATATAAAVIATTAAVSRQYEQLETCPPLVISATCDKNLGIDQRNNIADCSCYEQPGNSHKPDGGIGQKPDVVLDQQEAERISDKSSGNESNKSDVAIDDVTEWEIQWEEITLGERIGLGSYGEVYRGDWHGTKDKLSQPIQYIIILCLRLRQEKGQEVAVKKFLDQDISGDALEEFRSEVRIMKRLRHPNVVLFMGAVTRVPNLSIVTEFLPRGSLFRLIHRPNNQLDERRRLRMALDVARGMNYLHNCTPTIVHRDLKTPNLLVDRNWVVKVCDFGLSRMKQSTFLSSRSFAGTFHPLLMTWSMYIEIYTQAEWMAPEVLKNEPSDEKCDVYSFGVILWELSTLQQPWDGLNAMQVVGAVGYQERRLDIPEDMDPVIAGIITKCWQTNPKLRPSFSEILAILKPLQKPMTNTQVQRTRGTTGVPEKGGSSSTAE